MSCQNAALHMCLDPYHIRQGEEQVRGGVKNINNGYAPLHQSRPSSILSSKLIFISIWLQLSSQYWRKMVWIPLIPLIPYIISMCPELDWFCFTVCNWVWKHQNLPLYLHYPCLMEPCAALLPTEWLRILAHQPKQTYLWSVLVMSHFPLGQKLPLAIIALMTVL